MKHWIQKTSCSLLLILLGSTFNSSHAQVVFNFGYGASVGKVNDLNQIIYMHNLRNNVEKKMQPIYGGNGPTFAVGYEEDGLGMEIKWSNVHAARKSKFQFNNTLHRQDLRFRRNSIDINFYGNFDGQGNVGLGVDYSKLTARSRKYGDGLEATEYTRFVSEKGRILSGAAGGISVFGTYYIKPFIGVRATYRYSLFEGSPSEGFSEFMNAGFWSTVNGTSFTPGFKWSSLKIELLIKIGGEW